MADLFGNLGGQMFGWFNTLWLWLAVFFGAIILAVGFLLFLRWGKMKFPVLEEIGIGNDKVSVKRRKAGWVKSNRMFFGLIERGGIESMCLNDGRRVLNFSSTDFQDIDGRPGIICRRHDIDPKMVVPISTVKISNTELIEAIAPADYRDAATEFMKKAEKETMGWLEQNWQAIANYAILFFGIIMLIVLANVVGQQLTEARQFYIKYIEGRGGASVPSNAP